VPENLYNTSSSSVASSSTSPDNNWWNGISQIISAPISFDPIIQWTALFVLAWIIIHTILLLIDSVMHYFVFAPQDDFYDNIEGGKKRFYDSWYIWWTYLLCMLPFGLYVFWTGNTTLTFFFGMITLIALLCQFFFVDLGKSPLLAIFKGEDNTIIGKTIKSIKENTKKVKEVVSPEAKKPTTPGKEPEEGFLSSQIREVLKDVGEIFTGTPPPSKK
jgi:hypothetical protein